MKSQNSCNAINKLLILLFSQVGPNSHMRHFQNDALGQTLHSLIIIRVKIHQPPEHLDFELPNQVGNREKDEMVKSNLNNDNNYHFCMWWWLRLVYGARFHSSCTLDIYSWKCLCKYQLLQYPILWYRRQCDEVQNHLKK